jgi:hypothetical protein
LDQSLHIRILTVIGVIARLSEPTICQVTEVENMEKRDWRKGLTPTERAEMRKLEKEISVLVKTGKSELNSERMTWLKYKRKVLQNRVTVRVRRELEN